MKVFKFGGASVKDPRGVRNVAAILHSMPAQPLIVVVSAMGKTTNALEKILSLSRSGNNYQPEFSALQSSHEKIIQDLFPRDHSVFRELADLFKQIESQLHKKFKTTDQAYDQVVSLGEMISTIIVHRYLLSQKIDVHWIDARDYIATDNTYREGKVDWNVSQTKIQGLKPMLQKNKIIITQGFIGKSPEGFTTTLGRDGSDYTAAIFASCIHAESVTIWKDVPGVMNADPKRLPDAATVFKELPFREAAEMTYYGASVIHPKTIKPLANKRIPLYVKSFDDPTLEGTKIHECKVDNLPPLIVFKDNQCLVSCKVTDYTFITEDQLRTIFNVLSDLNVRINLMQNSAISFSFCVDFREEKISALIRHLHEHFEVFYNSGLTLITVKNYDDKTFNKYHTMKGVLMEQVSRSTLQVLVKPGQEKGKQ
jgi:aspartate kinase